MQFYSYVFFQLDQARAYIQDGRPEPLRLALLLLDNCAEMQMAEHIRNEMSREWTRERMQRSYRGIIPENDPSPIVQEVYAFQPLTAKQKQRIDRFFDDKLRYMVDRSKHLRKALADSLQHLHRYRNEAYHRNEVRPATIRAACLILLEINCEMLNIPRAYMSYRSDSDYSWLKARFGIERMISGEEVEGIVRQLRSDLIPETSHIADILADYMEGRFEAFYGELDYIVMNLQQVASQEAALIEAFEYRESRVDNPENEIPPMKIERRTLAWFKVREEQVALIRSAKSRLEAFEQFAAIERDLEPTETAVSEVVTQIDSYIDMQVDIARGK